MNQNNNKTSTEMAILLASINPNNPKELIDELINADFFKTEQDAALFIYESILTSVSNGEDTYPIHYSED